MAKILLVDDDISICRVAEYALSNENHEIEVAYDGKEGLQKAVAGSPDLVITDLMMPKMDGLTMLTRMRRAGIEAPALLSTSLPEVSLAYIPPKPYHAVLEKPYRVHKLLEMVGKLLNED